MTADRAIVASASYSRDDFLRAVATGINDRLPASLRSFKLRQRWGFIQISYRDHRIHYEVWPQPKNGLIELGLHIEADALTNESLANAIARRTHDVRHALGPECELEDWTASWRRLHRTVRYLELDRAKADECADWLARCISTLQPVVDLWQDGLNER